MTDNELLSAISDMMDKKLDERLKPINDTLKSLKFNQEHMSDKLRGIEVAMNYNDYNLSHDIKKVQEDVETIVEILKIHDMIPLS